MHQHHARGAIALPAQLRDEEVPHLLRRFREHLQSALHVAFSCRGRAGNRTLATPWRILAKCKKWAPFGLHHAILAAAIRPQTRDAARQETRRTRGLATSR